MLEHNTKHLFISSLILQKDMETGLWRLHEVATNQGRFALGDEVNQEIDQNLLDQFMLHAKQKIAEQLTVFLEQEQQHD